MVGQPIAFDLGTDEYIYSVSNGSISAAPSVSLVDEALIVAELDRYVLLWEAEFGSNSGLGVGYTVLVPSNCDIVTLMTDMV